MVETKSLKINAVLNVTKSIIGIIFPIITFPYVSRKLQVEAIGAYNFSASIVSYFVLLSGLGITTYAIREGAQYRDDKEKINKFISEIFSINFISTAFSYVILGLALMSIDKLGKYIILILILSIEMIMTTLSVNWVCNIYEDFLFIALQTIVVQCISLALTVVFVKSPDDLFVYVSIIAFSKTLISIINFVYIRMRYSKFNFTWAMNLKTHLKPILIIFSTSIAITVYVSSDTTMLGFMLSDYEVGLYSTAVKIYAIIKNILASALIVLVPRFSIFFRQNADKEKINTLFSKIFISLLTIMVPAITGLFCVSKDVILLIGGPAYRQASTSLMLLCVGIFFSLIAYMNTQCVLIPAKKEGLVFKATFISAVVNILLNFILIPIWGINGTAVTTIIAEFIVCILSMKYSKDFVQLNYVIIDTVKISIGCVSIALICFACAKYIHVFFIRVTVEIIVSATVYFFVEIFLKNSVIGPFIQKVRDHFL